MFSLIELESEGSHFQRFCVELGSLLSNKTVLIVLQAEVKNIKKINKQINK